MSAIYCVPISGGKINTPHCTGTDRTSSWRQSMQTAIRVSWKKIQDVSKPVMSCVITSKSLKNLWVSGYPHDKVRTHLLCLECRVAGSCKDMMDEKMLRVWNHSPERVLHLAREPQSWESYGPRTWVADNTEGKQVWAEPRLRRGWNTQEGLPSRHRPGTRWVSHPGKPPVTHG